MKTIYKYKLKTTDLQSIIMPAGAKVLCVQVQQNVICLWAMVDPDAESERRSFRIYGTGSPVHKDGEYLGTVQFNQGSLIFHIFDVTRS